MKKYIILFSATALSLAFIGNNDVEIPENTPELVVSSDTAQIIIPEIFEEPTIVETETEPLYIARNLDGYVAIFVPRDQSPCILTDIFVKTLPHEDQKMLETGIILDENYTLAEFIQDYSS